VSAVLRQAGWRWWIGRPRLNAHRLDRSFNLRFCHRPSARSFHAREGSIAELRSKIGLREPENSSGLREVIDNRDHPKLLAPLRRAFWGILSTIFCRYVLPSSRGGLASLRSPRNNSASQAITSLSRYRTCRPIRAYGGRVPFDAHCASVLTGSPKRSAS